MNFNSNNNINNQFGCLPLHSIRLPLRLRLRLRINRLNSKNKQQHTTACTKPRQMQQVRVPGLDLTIDIHPVLQAPSRKLQLWAQSLTEPWAESWCDPPPPGPGPPHPAPALTPSLAQISGDPAWQHSSKYCTIFWNKDKTTRSFTINIPKILAYCCTIYSDHLSLF